MRSKAGEDEENKAEIEIAVVIFSSKDIYVNYQNVSEMPSPFSIEEWNTCNS